jgi:hypothetical protein
MKRLIVGLAVAGAFAGGVVWAQGVGDHTYAECKRALDEIAGDIAGYQARLDNGYAQIATATAGLEGMPAKWADYLGTVNAESAADPGNEAWSVSASEAALLQAEFLALRSEAQAQKAALDAL